MTAYFSGYRVLDLADRALLAGQMLAKLGAEVIQIEPPEGSVARRMGPFSDDAGTDSLHWSAYAAGKRSVMLDLAAEEGRETLRRLAATADFLLESQEPGLLAGLGLGPDDLRAINPRLIYVSVTPFGSTGPKALWQESDLILWAAGGPLFPSRDGDRPPLRLSVPQAWLHAAGDAVCGALIAHHARLVSGQGQQVDISVQQSVTQATLSSIVAEAVGHPDFSFGVPANPKKPAAKKMLDLSGSGARTRRSKWQIADGLVEMHLAIGPASGAKTNNFFAWMRDEGALPERMYDWDWVSIPKAITEGRLSEEDLEEAREVTAAFLATKKKADIIDEALRRKILIAPLLTVEDLVQSRHHAARGFFQRVVERGRTLALPGDFAMGMEGGFRPVTPAPSLGEGNAALLGALPPCANAAVTAAAAASPPLLPFQGLKVVDLAWVVAGPMIGRVLADYGATVVRVESSKRVDTARMMGPFPEGKFDAQRSALFDSCNAGKLGLSLDLAQPEARQVVRDLVAWGDVVIESFAPGQMERWGLGYEALRTIKPDLVMLSTSLMGQSGPYAAFAGFGNIGAAVSGFQSIVGWPDALPVGPFGPYTDYIGPRFGTAALLAALDRRRHSGEGCWIDVSQAEAGMQFLAPQFAAFAATGAIAGADGNRDPAMAPHGVFPAAGEDRWIAIAIRSDAEWERLAARLGDAAADPAFGTFGGRKADEDRLERIVAAWTATLPAEDIEQTLQAEGIAAHVVASSADMVGDVQLRARGHFIALPNADSRDTIVEASRFTLSATPAVRPAHPPSFGRDNHFVLRELLGYDAARLSALEDAGILV